MPDPQPGRQGHPELHLRAQDAVPLRGERRANRKTLTIDQESVPAHEETLRLNQDSSMRLLYQKSVQVD